MASPQIDLGTASGTQNMKVSPYLMGKPASMHEPQKSAQAPYACFTALLLCELSIDHTSMTSELIVRSVLRKNKSASDRCIYARCRG